MNRFKIVILSFLLVAVGSLTIVTSAVAHEPGLPGTTIPGNRLFATGNEVLLQFLGGYAGYDVYLFLFDYAGQPADGPPIFHNQTTPSGTTYNAGNFTAGDELIFGIFVKQTGKTYYSGPPGNNPDDALHVRFFDTSDTSVDGFYTIGVGFEDLWGGGDKDFQDIYFQARGVTIDVPEPASMLLLASGLLGLGGVGLVRRRRLKAEEEL